MIKIIEKTLKIEAEELSIIIRNAAYIVILSASLGFVVNIFHPKGFTFVSTNMEKNKNIVLISSEEAKIKKDSGSAIFIDTRQHDEFEISHILGAINIPAVPASISVKKIEENFEFLSKPKELILYCDGTSCGSSQILANKLIEMGYSKHIYIIKNGILEWEDKDFPVASLNPPVGESKN